MAVKLTKDSFDLGIVVPDPNGEYGPGRKSATDFKLRARDAVRSALEDEFPNLRIASVENGAEFLPDLFRKLRSQDKKMPGYFGEDPVDHMQRQILRGTNELPPILERLMRIHVTEEARHLSFLETGRSKPSRVWRETTCSQA